MSILSIQSHRTSHILVYCERVDNVLEMAALRTNMSSMSFIPLLNSRVDIPGQDCNRTESTAVSAIKQIKMLACLLACSVHHHCMSLHGKHVQHGRPYLIVNQVEVWAVERPYIQRNLFWRLYTQQFDSFSSAICMCTVLLNFNKSL